MTRQDHEPMMVMPLAELEGMRETLHLLSTPAMRSIFWLMPRRTPGR